ncbi:hypothetical protein Hanom_Chr02g00149651 [Helianthus anomalus]
MISSCSTTILLYNSQHLPLDHHFLDLLLLDFKAIYINMRLLSRYQNIVTGKEL